MAFSILEWTKRFVSCSLGNLCCLYAFPKAFLQACYLLAYIIFFSLLLFLSFSFSSISSFSLFQILCSHLSSRCFGTLRGKKKGNSLKMISKIILVSPCPLVFNFYENPKTFSVNRAESLKWCHDHHQNSALNFSIFFLLCGSVLAWW